MYQSVAEVYRFCDASELHIVPIYIRSKSSNSCIIMQLMQVNLREVPIRKVFILIGCGLRIIEENSWSTITYIIRNLTLVKACLNSRPITPLSDDPNDDLSPLTPRHWWCSFSNLGARHSRSAREYIVQMAVGPTEYISSWQQQIKWHRTSIQLLVGNLVIVNEGNSPPLQWSMGHVVDLHLGKDRLCKMVSLKTSSGIIKRAVNRLCPVLHE